MVFPTGCYPFGLFYHLTENLVFVIAVLDVRQSPASIKSRLDADS